MYVYAHVHVLAIACVVVVVLCPLLLFSDMLCYVGLLVCCGALLLLLNCVVFGLVWLCV